MVAKTRTRKPKDQGNTAKESMVPVKIKLAKLTALARELGKTAANISSNSPSAAARPRVAEAIGQAHAAIRDALDKLRAVQRSSEAAPPVLPEPDADGNYPASETLRVILAQQIAERRQRANLSQAELAKRAGLRQETVSRLESGKHAPTVRTVEKIDRVLSDAGA